MEKLRRLLETCSPVSRDYPRHMKLSKTSLFYDHKYWSDSGQGSKPQNLVANKRSNGNWGNPAPFSESCCLHHGTVLACVANWERKRKNLGTRENMYPPNIDGWRFSKISRGTKSSHSCSCLCDFKWMINVYFLDAFELHVLKRLICLYCDYLQILLSSEATTSKSRFSTKMDLNREMLLVCSEADDNYR